MVYFYTVEYNIGNIDLIMNYLSAHLIIGNLFMILLVIKIRQVYDRIESDLGSRFGNHNTYYHLIYNC